MEMAKITPEDVDALAYTKGISLPFNHLFIYSFFKALVWEHHWYETRLSC